MGKAKKEHRKKVEARNRRLKERQNRIEKEYAKMYMKVMKEKLAAQRIKTGTTVNPEAEDAA